MQQATKWTIASLGILTGAIAGLSLLRVPVPSPFFRSNQIRLPNLFPGWTASADGGKSTITFLVAAGGGAPSYNEIALEKNVRYFQRTLAHMGWNPAITTTFFANGHDGQQTVRYIDFLGRERFKAPDIENLTGAATLANVQDWLQAYPETANGAQNCPAFFYFTGHGGLNRRNPDDNNMILWEEDLLPVTELAAMLDQWPADIPFVTGAMQNCGGDQDVLQEDKKG